MDADLTSRAKLRDAMIALVAEGQKPTARLVAERAGISFGLIRHHFGSVKGLQKVCDEHVAALVRASKEQAIAQGAGVDVMSQLRAADNAHLMRYLARRLAQPSQEIDELVDLLAADAAEHMQQSIDNGIMQPMEDVPRAAKMLTVYALGSLVLHSHLDRLLSVDLTQADLAEQVGTADYLAVQADIFGGMYSPEIRETLKKAYGNGK